MVKKNFQNAPKPQEKKQPTPEQIAAFEQGGAGHDEKPQNHITVNEVSVANDKTSAQNVILKRLSVDMPEDDHTRFKTACSKTKRKMTTELLNFIRIRTVELEDEASTTHN